MGFRLIKEHSPQYQLLRSKLKESELKKEAIRWSKLTSHSQSDCEDFIDKFHEVLIRTDTDAQPRSCLASNLSSLIKQKQMNLVTIQGNLEIDRLMELIADLPLESP
ncbi:MAG: hypothetical protein AB8G05_23585 [Oligoflexales bacterium]